MLYETWDPRWWQLSVCGVDSSAHIFAESCWIRGGLLKLHTRSRSRDNPRSIYPCSISLADIMLLKLGGKEGKVIIRLYGVSRNSCPTFWDNSVHSSNTCSRCDPHKGIVNGACPRLCELVPQPTTVSMRMRGLATLDKHFWTTLYTVSKWAIKC